MSLYVHESGAAGAPTILFLHAIGTSSWMWQAQSRQFPDYHCLLPDLPGHGQSNGEAWISLADTAMTVADIIRTRAHGGRAHVVGLSLGSYVAMELMSKEPDVVDHAVLSGLNVLPFPYPSLMKLMGILLLPFIKTDLMARTNARAMRIPAADQEAYSRSLRLMSRTAYLRASSNAGAFRLPPNVTSIRCPTLVVAGQREHPLIHQSLAAVVAAMSAAQARVAPGVGHGWNGETPDLFARTVRAWISDSPLPVELLPGAAEQPLTAHIT